MNNVVYPVAEPWLDHVERELLLEAFDSGWISSQGSFLERLENDFARFTGTRHALAACNGTAAIHLALLALDLKPGDQVLIPTLTFVATANAVRYCGAEPVPVDCDPETWNIDPGLVEAAVTPRTVGIVAVHLYGHPCDMAALQAIADRHGLWVAEDAAQSHGAEYHGVRTGGLARIAAFSLYGNKVLTTGEGGMVVTNDDELARRVMLYRGQGMDPGRRYWHPVVGYNYRMTNLAAAIGVGQLQKAEALLAARRRVAGWYAEELAGCRGVTFQRERPDVRSAWWMTTLRLTDVEPGPGPRNRLMELLAGDGIESRPVFYPVHTLPPYLGSERCPVAEAVSDTGFNLPSAFRLSRDDVRFIASRVRHHLAACVDSRRAA